MADEKTVTQTGGITLTDDVHVFPRKVGDAEFYFVNRIVAGELAATALVLTRGAALDLYTQLGDLLSQGDDGK